MGAAVPCYSWTATLNSREGNPGMTATISLIRRGTFPLQEIHIGSQLEKQKEDTNAYQTHTVRLFSSQAIYY